jgi:hypothetical protein
LEALHCRKFRVENGNSSFQKTLDLFFVCERQIESANPNWDRLIATGQSFTTAYETPAVTIARATAAAA